MSTIEDVKRLREETGVGMMDCKQALLAAGGDVEKAKEILREEGKMLLAQQEGREANEGRVEAYVHHSGKVGVLVEIATNTDFAANSEEFREFARDVALHIAASAPLYVAQEAITEADREERLKAYREEALEEGKPAEIVEKIIEGKMRKFLAEACLLDQPFVKDEAQTIGELLAALRSKTGENITIRQFARFEIGE
jgi:elongation factor Ts